MEDKDGPMVSNPSVVCRNMEKPNGTKDACSIEHPADMLLVRCIVNVDVDGFVIA
jgi:hypothetical protein